MVVAALIFSLVLLFKKRISTESWMEHEFIKKSKLPARLYFFHVSMHDFHRESG